MIYFAIVLHFHQPVGNFTEVFERAYGRCYKPFLEKLPYYPDIQISLHISGSLIDYFRKEHPDILKLIKDMAKKGQLEIMGGPYYEPILTAIPPKDIKGQIDLMTKSIKDEFSYKPIGLWIPERVWHPDLVKYLYNAGMRYCILDDTHLMQAGLKKEDTYGYFMTGKRFKRIFVFPSDKMLRYTIPFKAPDETIDYFKKISSKRRDPLFVYGDDMEKFGEWPGTYNLVYEKGWLKSFFDSLLQNKEWIKTIKLSDYLKDHRPLSRLHIPEASYEEMMEWAGGPSWFNFLKKYPESDHMYRKMQYVSNKVEEFKKGICKNDNDSKYWAEVELYRGECNCAYWHGIFGGLYMHHLRSAIYNHLIAAENIIDKVRHKEKRWIEVKEFDLDGDGRDEFIIEGEPLSLYFDPEEGGVLKELDYRPICINLINTLSRKREKYHDKKEPPLNKGFIYDKYTRYCLRDYFVNGDLKKEDFISSSFEDYGNFANGNYIAKKKANGLVLEHKSSISGIEIELSKDITVKDSIIEVSYRIKKAKDRELNILFGTEFNLTMPFLNSDRYCYFSNGEILDTLNGDGKAKDIHSFDIRDTKKELGLKFLFSKKAQEVWYYPVETISQSQITYKSNYQCTSIFPLWKLDFDKEGIETFKITWHIGSV